MDTVITEYISAEDIRATLLPVIAPGCSQVSFLFSGSEADAARCHCQPQRRRATASDPGGGQDSHDHVAGGIGGAATAPETAGLCAARDLMDCVLLAKQQAVLSRHISVPAGGCGCPRQVREVYRSLHHSTNFPAFIDMHRLQARD